MSNVNINGVKLKKINNKEILETLKESIIYNSNKDLNKELFDIKTSDFLNDKENLKTDVIVENKEIINSQNLDLEKNTIKKILLVTSEAQPFCATGGMADVCGSLPKEIRKINTGIDIRVIMPLYSVIPKDIRDKLKYIGYNYTTLSWRREYAGVFEYEENGVTFYFIDNERYFKRDCGIYGYYDDVERFAFFSKSVLEILPVINFFPDIIHSNDWHSALIPVYLKTAYFDNRYKNIKTILTIHNISYQGRFGQEILEDVLGIDKKFKNLLSYDGDINILKAGIVCADKITTVSPSYAQEIKTKEHSAGLHHIIKENSYKLIGILNGIDYDFYNPETDKIIYHNYNAENLDEKKENKKALQREFNLEINEEIPIIGFCSRMNKMKGFDLIKQIMEKVIIENKVQFVGVGCGDREYEDYFKYLNYKYKGRVSISLGFSNHLGRKIYSGADIYIMPSISEPCGLSQIIASKYGVIPIIRETGGLKDTIKDFGCEGGGNGYTFSSANAYDFEYLIKRAISDYKDKKGWREKVQKVMSKDFSWSKTAGNYIDTYLSL